MGLDRERLTRAQDLLAEWVASGLMPAAALCVGRDGAMAEPRVFGAPPDSLFLVASLTKPVTAAAVMMLVERGTLVLDDRVADYIPEFAHNGKADVRLRHLLTHTSGLPDMLPENVALRAAHAPLDAFVAGTCRQPLSFPSGTRVRYQSMGFAVLAEVVRRVTGLTLAAFLERELFAPLGMGDSYLGVGPDHAGRIAPLVLEAEQAGTDWGWNSSYWRRLGAPWGGLITKPGDYARFAQLMLDEGRSGDRRVLAAATVRAMTTNQLEGMPLVPEDDRRCRPWGLGWRLHWPAQSAHFGDLLGPRAFGHWGATGTLCWIDPDARAYCVVFTTLPAGDDGRHLARVSNAVAAALS
jgi:CubicO group peptidase (beta-lactamase class C family)